MPPWFIATKKFGPSSGTAWRNYVAWSGLTQLEELVSLDPILCPPVLPEIKDDYWPHIVNEDFMLHFFTDFDFLAAQTADVADMMLCVFRNPSTPPVLPSGLPPFDFLGYDLVDVMNSASALSNCGGFPEAFVNLELTPLGLLDSHSRGIDVQRRLRQLYPGDTHADCHLWAIFRSAALS